MLSFQGKEYTTGSKVVDELLEQSKPEEIEVFIGYYEGVKAANQAYDARKQKEDTEGNRNDDLSTNSFNDPTEKKET